VGDGHPTGVREYKQTPEGNKKATKVQTLTDPIISHAKKKILI